MKNEHSISLHLGKSVLSISKTAILFLILCSHAEEICAQRDSTYIGDFPQDLFLRTYVYKKFMNLSHEIQEGNETTYQPNTPVGLGLGVNFKNFSLFGGIAFDFMRDKKRGKTTSYDFQYHYYGKKFLADIFFQNYKGFYVEDEKLENVFYQYPDLKLIQYGIYGEYIFNHNKYSYRAGFYQRERQLKSTGSFQLGGGIYYNGLSGNETFLPEGEQRYSNYQLSINEGYAHTFVIKHDFYISLALSVGLSLGNKSLSNFFKDIEISPNMFPRLSAGYNGKTWSLGLNVIINRIYVSQSDDMKLMFDTGKFTLSFTKRFDIRTKKTGKYLYSLPYFKEK